VATAAAAYNAGIAQVLKRSLYFLHRIVARSSTICKLTMNLSSAMISVLFLALGNKGYGAVNATFGQ